MEGRIKIVTAPTVEPVTLTEALRQCHADPGTEDAWFTLAITAARVKAEEYQNRAFLQQTINYILDGYPCLPLKLPMSPVTAVSSIKTYDTDNTEVSLDLTDFYFDYNSDPAMINLDYGKTWPTTTLRANSSIVIQYVAGYGMAASSVPSPVKMAILFLVGYWYENRGMEHNIPDSFYNTLRPNRLHI
jgi:uncharacterized phiE125 gp8 family phage protein